ncbi:MAG: PD-(D/E)XK nuclease family protein [Prevotellaceae bacterium]|jgi:hypothetical protein|nr:PD-(D/E)XK nuclease family protein [Prevotellaceae bacterium]
MTPFLQLVAEDLFIKYGSELSDITVVFPNNRARLFFNEQLATVAEAPVWSPNYVTIQELFRQHSSLEIPDTLKLVSDLFSVYNEEVPRKETFDEFYFWGEILLNDFDDVDKNRIDALTLFANIREQAEFIDTFEHLTEEQKESLRMFFRNFSPDMRTELKERFMQLWDALIFVYQGFREKLLNQGLAYEGMLNRLVVEELKKQGTGKFQSKRYVFIGFNVLNKCEKELFVLLQKAGKTHFYWDYDTFYLDKKYHEAGTFQRENLALFPNELSKTHFSRFNVGEKRHITFVSASTENAQAKFLNSYLSRTKEAGEQDRDIAVVLCNESLLLPVLHSIPDRIEDINVTMGFPLMQTPAYSLVKNLLEMQVPSEGKKQGSRFRYDRIIPVLKHPYIRITIPETNELIEDLTIKNRFYPASEELHATENLRLLFTSVATPAELTAWLLQMIRFVASFHKKNTGKAKNSDEKELIYDDLYKEALFRIYTQINRLHILLENDSIRLSFATLTKLLKNMLASVTIPFSGEPVKGMQVMGFLETRNLDFKNVVLLSVNEGILPNSGKESSFIPHNLRKGYGMTTIEHKNSLYAYYFYRFLQRAENITLVYNTATEGMNRGEMSRFMLQLLAETGFDIEMQDIRSNIRVVEPQAIEVKKTGEIVSFLISKYDTRQNEKAYFSPSALNSLINCSLRFYFKYVLQLKIKEELTEGVEASMFGTIFHASAEMLYRDKAGKNVQAEELVSLSKNRKKLEETVDFAFKTQYFKLDAGAKMPEYTGEQLINRKVVVDFLQKLLQLDARYAPFLMLKSEEYVSEEMELETPSGNIRIKIGGIVDRIDQKEDILRIVDYKTGGTPYRPSGVASLFEQRKDRADYIFQAFLYAVIRNRELAGKQTVKPVLFYIHKAGNEYSPDICFSEERKSVAVDSISPYEEEFRAHLSGLIRDLFDKNVSFTQTKVKEKCLYCDYRDICRRKG